MFDGRLPRSNAVGALGRSLLAVMVLASRLAAAEPAPLPPLCGTRSTPPPLWDHVVWIWFENHSYGDVIGASDAPFFRRLARSCGLATNYHSLTHPSLPNYIAATSGLALDALGPLREDCNATGNCHSDAMNIFSQAPSWGSYAESMPNACTHWFFGSYAASHNPAVYYRDLTDDCPQHSLNLRALWGDLGGDRLPAFVSITPNMCHSMHNCSVGTGDGWLRHVIRRLADGAPYRRGSMAIVVTFDESGKDDSSNHIATLVVSPSTPPRSRSNEYFTHYSLLRTTEEMLGIDHLLGQAAHAHSMRRAFNL